ncbi:MAG: response regulator [Lachnospiraceae bacterium]|nr:response regulator [Lachnospiraceae bacterium]
MSNHFGETLRTLRTEKNMSQQQLAQRLFVNRSSIANWENGRRIPDLILITRLARLLNVDVSVLTDAANTDPDSPEVIIIDDEAILLSGAIPVLSEVMPRATITGFLKPSEAVDYAKETMISIAFLDIEMGKHNGIDICRTLMEINPLTNVIFLTSYPDYAVDAWNTAASGFLVKPLSAEGVKEQLEKLRHPVRGL